jgi:hypothetical protein
VNILDWVLDLTLCVSHLNILHGVDYHISKEISLTEEEFAAHAGLSSVNERISAQSIGFDRQIFLDKVDRLFKSETISGHDAGGMHLILNELICSL